MIQIMLMIDSDISLMLKNRIIILFMIKRETLSTQASDSSHFWRSSATYNHQTLTRQRNMRFAMLNYLLIHAEMVGSIMKENAEQLSSKALIYQIFANDGSKGIRKYLTQLKERLLSQEEQTIQRLDKKRMRQCDILADLSKLSISLIHFQALSDNMVARYYAGVEQTMFEVCLLEMYGKNKPRLIRDVIKTRAYQDIDSAFFKKFPSYVIRQQKSPLQFILDFAKILDSDIDNAIIMLGEIDQLQGKWQIIQHMLRKVYLLVKFKVQAVKFVKDYRNEFKDDFILRILRTRYRNNQVKLVKDLINFRVFSDPKYKFMQEFLFHQDIKSEIKDEILKNSSYCLKKLEQCRTIINMME